LCFAATSWYEITAGGKKLVGSAQRRWVSHFLQHGSLILDKSSIEGPLPTEGKMPRLTSDRQIALADLLPRLPPVHALEQALKAGFEAALPIHLVQGDLTGEEKVIAGRLIKEKYGNDRWNLYRETAENPH
ncbi:MAG: biotin/lipoate A/B protein ligase family protein, partial [Nitrospiria bacterium]